MATLREVGSRPIAKQKRVDWRPGIKKTKANMLMWNIFIRSLPKPQFTSSPYPMLRSVIKKFLRMRAVVRCREGVDKVKVRLPRFLEGRLLTIVLPQLLLESLALLLLLAELVLPELVDAPDLFFTPSCLHITSGASNGAATVHSSTAEGSRLKLSMRWWFSSRLSLDGLNVKPTMPSSLARGRTDLDPFQYWICVET